MARSGAEGDPGKRLVPVCRRQRRQRGLRRRAQLREPEGRRPREGPAGAAPPRRGRSDSAVERPADVERADYSLCGTARGAAGARPFPLRRALLTRSRDGAGGAIVGKAVRREDFHTYPKIQIGARPGDLGGLRGGAGERVATWRRGGRRVELAMRREAAAALAGRGLEPKKSALTRLRRGSKSRSEVAAGGEVVLLAGAARLGQVGRTAGRLRVGQEIKTEAEAWVRRPGDGGGPRRRFEAG